MKTYIQLLLVVLFLPVLSACDQEDDVIDIFTGKTWYMTYIAVEGQNKMYDFWLSMVTGVQMGIIGN